MDFRIKKILTYCRQHQVRANSAMADIERVSRGIGVMRESIPRMATYGGDYARRLGEQIRRLRELEAAYSDAFPEAEEFAAYVSRLIRRLPAAQERIIRLRYIKALSWVDVAKTSMYSESHCYDLHRQALIQLQIILDTEHLPAPICVRRLFHRRKRHKKG